MMEWFNILRARLRALFRRESVFKTRRLWRHGVWCVATRTRDRRAQWGLTRWLENMLFDARW